MNKRNVLMLLTTLPYFLYAQVDGFNKGKGNMDLAASYSYQIGMGYWAGPNEISLKRDITAASFYVAYGITNDLDVSIGIPYVTVGDNGDLQDGQFYVKWMPMKRNLSNGKFLAGVALGASGPLTEYQTEGIGALGQQATVISPLLVTQYHFPSGMFVGLVGGYHIKGDPVPNAIPFTLRVGAAKSKLFWEAYGQHQTGIGGKDYRGEGDLAIVNTFKEIGVSFTRVGGKVYRAFSPNFGAALDVSYVVAGRNADRALGMSVAFVYKISKKAKSDQ